jgi:hypothetical protein
MPRAHAAPARAHPWVIRAIRRIPLPYLLTCALIGLYRLVRHPLAIDVFDTANLAPLY